MKNSRKFAKQNLYTGTVKKGDRQHTKQALGRTKREAVHRLRRMFAQEGIATRPDPLVDLLAVTR